MSMGDTLHPPVVLMYIISISQCVRRLARFMRGLGYLGHPLAPTHTQVDVPD